MSDEIDNALGLVESLPHKIINQEITPLSQEDGGDAHETLNNEYASHR